MPLGGKARGVECWSSSVRRIEMGAGIWFWIIFVIAIVFGGMGFGGVWGMRSWQGAWVVVMILLGLLGWHTFGPVVQ